MSKNASALMILKRYRGALLVAGFLGLLTCVTLNNLILNSVVVG